VEKRFQALSYDGSVYAAEKALLFNACKLARNHAE
jgi:hypothetical protein